MNNVTPGVYRADPSEIVADGGDLMRLANDILNQGSGLNYLLNISQDQISGVRAGAAVAEFVNPITRSTLKLTVHPWMSQGTALLMSSSCLKPGRMWTMPGRWPAYRTTSVWRGL